MDVRYVPTQKNAITSPLPDINMVSGLFMKKLPAQTLVKNVDIVKTAMRVAIIKPECFQSFATSIMQW